MAADTKAMEKIIRVQWGLLGEWWCAEIDATEDEIASKILEHFQAPGVGVDLVKDRLFGGFRCEQENRRHFDDGYEPGEAATEEYSYWEPDC